MSRYLYGFSREVLTTTSEAAAVLTQPQVEKLMRIVKIRAQGAIEPEIQEFRESMNRRFRRDVSNLEAYYSSLKAEMAKSLERPGLSEQVIRDRTEKMALIPEELIKKRDDVFKKYSIRVMVAPCAAMLILTPAVKILYSVSIGKLQKTLSIFYNPVTKSADPLACQGCGVGTFRIHFCKQQHVLCPKCSDTYPAC